MYVLSHENIFYGNFNAIFFSLCSYHSVLLLSVLSEKFGNGLSSTDCCHYVELPNVRIIRLAYASYICHYWHTAFHLPWRHLSAALFYLKSLQQMHDRFGNGVTIIVCYKYSHKCEEQHYKQEIWYFVGCFISINS